MGLHQLMTQDFIKLPGLPPIPVADILYLSADVNYTNVHFLNPQQPVSVSPVTLGKIERNHSLLRIHKKYVVNRNYVTGLVRDPKNKTSVITLQGDTRLEVARRRYNYVRASLSVAEGQVKS